MAERIVFREHKNHHKAIGDEENARDCVDEIKERNREMWWKGPNSENDQLSERSGKVRNWGSLWIGFDKRADMNHQLFIHQERRRNCRTPSHLTLLYD
jgi:hypothetical protein